MAHCFAFGRTLWKWVRPTLHMFFLFFENMVSLLPGQLVFFLSIMCTMQVGLRQGKSENFTINFQIREYQRISLFLEKIRDTSGDVIMDKGHKIKDIFFFVWFPWKYIWIISVVFMIDLIENFRSRLRRSHIKKSTKNLAPLAHEYWVTIVKVMV